MDKNDPRRTRLSEEDIETAIAWLECNEGDEGESDRCQRVARYLEGRLLAKGIRKAINQYKRERIMEKRT